MKLYLCLFNKAHIRSLFAVAVAVTVAVAVAVNEFEYELRRFRDLKLLAFRLLKLFRLIKYSFIDTYSTYHVLS